MKAQIKNIVMLIITVAANVLSVALGITVWIVSGDAVNDIVIPLGIFLVLGTVQTAAAIPEKRNTGSDRAFAISLILSVFKLVFAFCTEFFLDMRNIYFGSPEKTAISVCIILYLVSLVIVFICELSAMLLSKIRHSRSATTDKGISK